MGNDLLQTVVRLQGAWAKANNESTIAHWFFTNRPDMQSVISKCGRRVTAISNVQHPMGCEHCIDCAMFLSMESEVHDDR